MRVDAPAGQATCREAPPGPLIASEEAALLSDRHRVTSRALGTQTVPPCDTSTARSSPGWRQEGGAAHRADPHPPALRVGLVAGDDRGGRAEIARAAEGASAAAAEDDDGVAVAQRDAGIVRQRLARRVGFRLLARRADGEDVGGRRGGAGDEQGDEREAGEPRLTWIPRQNDLPDRLPGSYR